jgi:hypothetical protein
MGSYSVHQNQQKEGLPVTGFVGDNCNDFVAMYLLSYEDTKKVCLGASGVRGVQKVSIWLFDITVYYCIPV